VPAVEFDEYNIDSIIPPAMRAAYTDLSQALFLHDHRIMCESELLPYGDLANLTPETPLFARIIVYLELATVARSFGNTHVRLTLEVMIRKMVSQVFDAPSVQSALALWSMGRYYLGQDKARYRYFARMSVAMCQEIVERLEPLELFGAAAGSVSASSSSSSSSSSASSSPTSSSPASTVSDGASETKPRRIGVRVPPADIVLMRRVMFCMLGAAQLSEVDEPLPEWRAKVLEQCLVYWEDEEKRMAGCCDASMAAIRGEMRALRILIQIKYLLTESLYRSPSDTPLTELRYPPHQVQHILQQLEFVRRAPKDSVLHPIINVGTMVLRFLVALGSGQQELLFDAADELLQSCSIQLDLVKLMPSWVVAPVHYLAITFHSIGDTERAIRACHILMELVSVHVAHLPRVNQCLTLLNHNRSSRESHLATSIGALSSTIAQLITAAAPSPGLLDMTVMQQQHHQQQQRPTPSSSHHQQQHHHHHHLQQQQQEQRYRDERVELPPITTPHAPSLSTYSLSPSASSSSSSSSPPSYDHHHRHSSAPTTTVTTSSDDNGKQNHLQFLHYNTTPDWPRLIATAKGPFQPHGSTGAPILPPPPLLSPHASPGSTASPSLIHPTACYPSHRR